MNSINRSINIYNNNKSSSKVDEIISANMGDKNNLINKLSELDLNDLKLDTNNVYYCKLAIERKEDLARENNANFVHPNKIVNELVKIKKLSNHRYREKVEYNKRNNLDYKGRPKK